MKPVPKKFKISARPLGEIQGLNYDNISELLDRNSENIFKMKSSLSNTSARLMDNLRIFDLFKGEGFSFDFVIAELDGNHAAVRNHVSDKAYFILEGTGTVQIGIEKLEVNKDDFIKIPKGEFHSLNGKLRYIIICSPPFDPLNEEIQNA